MYTEAELERLCGDDELSRQSSPWGEPEWWWVEAQDYVLELDDE